MLFDPHAVQTKRALAGQRCVVVPGPCCKEWHLEICFAPRDHHADPELSERVLELDSEQVVVPELVLEHPGLQLGVARASPRLVLRGDGPRVVPQVLVVPCNGDAIRLAVPEALPPAREAEQVALPVGVVAPALESGLLEVGVHRPVEKGDDLKAGTPPCRNGRRGQHGHGVQATEDVQARGRAGGAEALHARVVGHPDQPAQPVHQQQWPIGAVRGLLDGFVVDLGVGQGFRLHRRAWRTDTHTCTRARADTQATGQHTRSTHTHTS